MRCDLSHSNSLKVGYTTFTTASATIDVKSRIDLLGRDAGFQRKLRIVGPSGRLRATVHASHRLPKLPHRDAMGRWWVQGAS